MKQKFLIVLALIFLVALLIGLNAATYVQKDKEPDREHAPNRSTYNTGATGTRAFYDLLQETGNRVTRWQENTTGLLNAKNKPDTLVIIGQTRLEINETETQDILRFVDNGGKLVIIDREPLKEFLITDADWNISTIPTNQETFGVDPTEQVQMTAATSAIKPSVPSIWTRNINAVQPSKFASSILLNYETNTQKLQDKKIQSLQNKKINRVVVKDDDFLEPPPKPVAVKTPNGDQTDQTPKPLVTPIGTLPTPKPTVLPTIETPKNVSEASSLVAPYIHLGDDKKNILVDFSYGLGKIVVLTDPYIVSNAGIGLVDNGQLAMNIVSSNNGVIAFDEYHQGYGANQNRLLAYFSDTPVIPIFAQIILLIGVVLYSQSRRFARALPVNEPNRLSKLEYISAMAELQQRTKAYDLAIENIFSEFRRSVTRYLGVDNFTTSRKDLAKTIAERLKMNELEVYNLMRKCEEIIQGEPTNKKEVLELTGKLREIEDKLGLKRTRKQGFRSKK